MKEKRCVRFRVPASACANGPVARVLTVVVGGSVVGIAVVGVAVVILASAPGQPVHLHRPRRALENGHATSLSPRNVYMCTQSLASEFRQPCHPLGSMN